jgi:SSS family transporter
MTQLSQTFTLIDYTVFILYLVATASIGLWFVRGQRDLNEYFLAGRSMGSLVVAMTILASLFSGISFLAAPGEGYANGPVFYLVTLGFLIATPVTNLVFLRFYYNSRFFTAYQYLEERFSVSLRTLASLSFIVRVLLWLAAATYAPALALEQVTGLPLWFTILCTGIVTTIYTTFGGMRAVIWTDIMQLIVLFGGQIIIVCVALLQVPGGLGRVIELGQAGGRLTLSTSLDPTVRITLWGLIFGAAFLHLVQMATDQVSVQRYLTARNLATARRGLWIKLALALPVSGLFYGTGLVLYAFYAVHGDPLAAGKITKVDQILPFFVVTQLPHGLPGLFIAAIYAASMSTISAGINSLTSASLVDFYQRLWRNPDLSEHNQLRLARVLTFSYGALVIALAFLVERLGTLLEATNKVISLIGGPLIGLFLLGMVLTRTTARGALVGWAAGLAMTIWVCFGTKVSFLWYALFGCATTMVVGYVVSLLGPPPSDRQLDGLTWARKRPLEE